MNIFGPLDKSACVYFLFFTVFFFVIFLCVLGAEMLMIVRNFKRLNGRVVVNGLAMLFNVFIAYFVNRLLYTMCNKSLI
jgi:hypothetical protein